MSCACVNACECVCVCACVCVRLYAHVYVSVCAVEREEGKREGELQSCVLGGRKVKRVKSLSLACKVGAHYRLRS